MKNTLTRRSALRQLSASALAVGGASALLARSGLHAAAASASPLKGRIHQSVCRWCYGKISLDDLCRAAKEMGIESVELLGPEDWPVVKKHGLTCAMCNGPSVQGVGGIAKGFNRIEYHEKLVPAYREKIAEVARAGLPSVICFSGNRAGLNDEQGLENCVVGLKQIMKAAEEHKVNVILELLNSKVDHKDYQCDHTAWGVEVCKRVGSERCKLLYDIYHMQIMEGDIIRTIRENIEYIGHFHTGGVPDRHEIDQTQELYYPAIMRAIAATHYQGFVGQEFIPKQPDALASLKEAVQICDV